MDDPLEQIMRRLRMRYDGSEKAQAEALRIKDRSRFAGPIESAGKGSRDVTKDTVAMAAIERVLGAERIGEARKFVPKVSGKKVPGRKSRK